MDLPLDQLADQLRSYLGRKRWQHSMNVAAVARELAQIHAPDLSGKAELAGILHDNAKRLTGAELIEAATRFDIEIADREREQPELLHGKVGAALAPERFGVDDPEVLEAIGDHVTGRPGMGLLSQLLYVADQASADRVFPGVEELREVARHDLMQAVFLVAGHKLSYIQARQRVVVEATVELYEDYKQRLNQRD